MPNAAAGLEVCWFESVAASRDCGGSRPKREPRHCSDEPRRDVALRRQLERRGPELSGTRNAADVVAVPPWPRRWGGEGARLVAMDLEDQHTPGLRRRSAALRRYQCRTVRALLQGMRHHRSQTYTVMYPRQAGKNQVAAELITALLRRHSRDGGSLVVCAPTYSPQAAISFERTRQILGASLRVMPEGYHELATAPVITVGRARAVFLS